MFEPFQQFISKSINRYGLSREFKAAKVCHDFRAIVPEIFENYPEISSFVFPAYFKDNTLMVNVKDPAWAQEVIMRKEKIIDFMNKKAGEEVIKKLKTKIANNELNK